MSETKRITFINPLILCTYSPPLFCYTLLVTFLSVHNTDTQPYLSLILQIAEYNAGAVNASSRVEERKLYRSEMWLTSSLLRPFHAAYDTIKRLLKAYLLMTNVTINYGAS